MRRVWREAGTAWAVSEVLAERDACRQAGGAFVDL